jgi:peptidoglycan hydrolase CwlO-like protein
MKKVQAFIAACIVTALIGVGIFVVGAGAISKANVAQAQSQTTTVNQASDITVSTQSASDAATQIAQLKGLIAQYQSREKQYKTQLDQANQQISQANQQLGEANQQVQSLRSVLLELQQRGIISIQSDGTIQLRVRARGGDD